MPQGPLGGPRPGAEPNRSLQVGFYASTLNERELEELLNDPKIISKIITFMEEEFSTQTSSSDLERLSTAIKINYNSAVLKLYSDVDGRSNRISLTKGFFEDLTGGTVRDINFDSR